jgi:hypothetical protein
MSKLPIFVETSVAVKVGTRYLPEADWQAVVQHLARSFYFVVSPLTFIEVLNSLARGSEESILRNRRRLEALSPLDPLNPIFLEMPGQFVLREVLGCGPILNTYQPATMREVMASILKLNTAAPELLALLAEVKDRHEFGITDYVAKYDEVKRIGQTTPDRELWLRAHLRELGILLPSAEELNALSSALDAAYEYSASVRQQLRNPSYLPSHETSGWIDPQQLFYLADPKMYMLYLDSDFNHRTGVSTQRSRLMKLSDAMAEVNRMSAVSSLVDRIHTASA